MPAGVQGGRGRAVRVAAGDDDQAGRRRRAWNDEREARLDLFRWLHRYNTVRRHSRLGHRSPIAYERTLRTTSTTLTEAA
ncbi:integrase core domain-containing protein [Streptomyces sp. NPDC048297]|uniref:integrase core domain-containing protein n=1 Tax=Streptomyces sp. NPDC048297 TaxID=3365531 RepID=UPI003714F6B7